MKRSVQTVRREMADVLEGRTGPSNDPGATYFAMEGGLLRRWLLLLEPPKRKVRPRDPARSARRATVKELDALCREVVFLRDGAKCRKCGKSDGLLDWAHVYSRRHRVTRWALEGSMVLCRGCHLWWHQSPTEAVEWWRDFVAGPYEAKRLERMKKATKCGPLELVKLALEKARKEYA